MTSTDLPTNTDLPNNGLTNIRMGDLFVAQGNTVLKTLLGSCLGLAVYCPKSGVGGLAHTVLPFANGRDAPPGKFVDTAVPELLRLIRERGGDSARLQVKLAGGANMLKSQAETTIGDQNLAAAIEILGQHRIQVVSQHCGGTQGRRMTLYPQSGRVTVEVVGGELIEI